MPRYPDSLIVRAGSRRASSQRVSVQVIAAGETGRAAESEFVSKRDGVTRVDGNGRQVRVQ